MSSADFARAQERLAARRQQRESEARARAAAQRESSHAAASVSRLPYPFNRVSAAGLSIWDTIRGREGTRPAFRVGQVDAELLDEELLELLKGQVGEGLKYFGSHLQDTYSPEIHLLLRSLLFKLTIWDHNASYGAHLQGLVYTDARHASPSSRPLPKPWQKAAYGLLSVGGRYAWAKWENWLLARSSDDYSLPSAPSTRIEKLTRVTNAISTTHEVAALTSFLVFLYNGRYRTLLDRLLRLRLAPATAAGASREVSFEYLNRQLVWHAFTEFLLFLLPLVGISRWRRLLSRFWRKAKTTVLRLFGRGKGADDDSDDAAVGGGELGFLPERTCAICYASQNPVAAAAGPSEAEMLVAASGGGVVGSAQTDVTNPYSAIPCGHVYCYVCLAQAIEGEEGEGWTCLRCGEVVFSCKPWDGDVVEEVARPMSGKSVGFAEEKGEEGLRDVEPVPEVDEREKEVEERVREEVEAGAGAVAGDMLDESEWARASEVVEREREETSSDEQSEEYDEGADELSEVEVTEGVE